jgi:multicomponent Na+:H+ antiporter subunit D
MSFAIITIIYASFMAVRAQNLKVRFAYSTASNLSYILLTAASMSESSMVASLTHMISHAIIKISIFFIVGAFLVAYHMKTIDDIKGIGGKLSISSACFVISSLGLIGIPLTCGFISKYYIITSLIDVHNIFATIGILAIVISSILTVIYTMTIVIKMYFPGNNFDYSEVGELKEVSSLMLIPIVITTVGVVALGLFSSQFIEFFKLIAQGI